MKSRNLLFLLLILSSSLLVGFKDTNFLEQDTIPANYIELSQDQTIAQTFTSIHSGLEYISVNLITEEHNEGVVHLRLYSNSTGRKELFGLVIPLSEINETGTYRFNIPPQNDSYLENYYLELNIQGSDILYIETGVPESNNEGALYINGLQQEAQLVFQLEYDPVQMIWGLVIQCLQWVWSLFLSICVFIIPGWAILLVSWKSWSKFDFLTKVGLSGGVSFALYPVLMLWSDAINVRVGELLFVWLPFSLSSGYIIWHYKKSLIFFLKHPKAGFLSVKENFRGHISWFGITAFIVVLLIVFVRLWAIRTLSIPMWGDSYQHTMITQLIIDNGGLFKSWMPYAPYESLTVHYGFPANSAVYAWISNVPSTRAVIWVGQIANILAVIGIYPIAIRIAKSSKWAGLGAILVAGLLSSMPNFYVNWGRYAQLTGQVILPIALILIFETVFVKQKYKRQIFICGLVFTGMVLSYYRIPLFVILFIPLFIVELIEWLHRKDTPGYAWVVKSLLILFVSGIFILPLRARLNTGELVQHITYDYNSSAKTIFENIIVQWTNLPEHYPGIILPLAVIAFLVGIIRKNWMIITLPLGIILLTSYSFGTLINLPFANFSEIFAIQIMLYTILGVMIGFLIDQVVYIFGKRLESISSIFLILVALFLMYSAKNVSDKNKYEYVTQADQRAFHWINLHVPETALFLVDGFTIYNGTSAVGSDSGWWIPLLTKRANTMPPQYALLNEKSMVEGYSRWVVDVINTFREYSPNSPEGIDAMCRWGITHVYIGQKQGTINSVEGSLLRWNELMETDIFDLVYQEDRVKIFVFNHSVCQNQ